jgi:hypothetical protein
MKRLLETPLLGRERGFVSVWCWLSAGFLTELPQLFVERFNWGRFEIDCHQRWARLPVPGYTAESYHR